MKKKSIPQTAASKIKEAGSFRQAGQKPGQSGPQSNLKGKTGGNLQRQQARRTGMR